MYHIFFISTAFLREILPSIYPHRNRYELCFMIKFDCIEFVQFCLNRIANIFFIPLFLESCLWRTIPALIFLCTLYQLFAMLERIFSIVPSLQTITPYTHGAWGEFSNPASNWLAAQPPSNQKQR